MGGGRIPLIAVTRRAIPVRGTTPSDHYSLLATIEDGLDLFDLLPELAEKRDARTSDVDRPATSSGF
jgi:hypothetical protein